MGPTGGRARQKDEVTKQVIDVWWGITLKERWSASCAGWLLRVQRPYSSCAGIIMELQFFCGSQTQSGQGRGGAHHHVLIKTAEWVLHILQLE